MRKDQITQNMVKEASRVSENHSGLTWNRKLDLYRINIRFPQIYATEQQHLLLLFTPEWDRK